MEMDAWFMRLGLVGLFGYFLWSMQRILSKLEKQLEKLGEHIERLYEDRNAHDRRLSIIEDRVAGGRRRYDPEERVQ